MSQIIKIYFTSMLNMFQILIHPTHVGIRTHNQCGDTTEKLQAPDDGCINI